jgi:hypothetical protein
VPPLSTLVPCPQDVLAICGGTLPAWTQRLVFGARFLFPFPLRRAYFKTTALGLPRALAHLQVPHSYECLEATDFWQLNSCKV